MPELRATPDDGPRLDALLLAVAAGERQAFEALYRAASPRLFAICLRLLSDRAEAEDVLQEVFVSIWHKAAQFDPHRADAAGWIFGIARNRRIDLARRKPLSQPEEMPDLPSLDPDAGQALALQQEASHLAAALARLAPEQADALRAAYFDDIPQSRISEMTGLPLGTIKSRIRLGLDRLRHELRSIAP